MKAVRIEHHPAVISSTQLRTMSRPLNELGITYFSHGRQYNNGRFAALATSPEFLAHYLEQEYYNVDLHTASDKHGDLVIWDHLERVGLSKKMHDEAGAFGVKHTFSVIEKNASYVDVFHFAADVADTYINQVYLAKLNFLKQFILNYKDTLNQDFTLQSIFHTYYHQINSRAGGYQIKDEHRLLSYMNDPLITPSNRVLLFEECCKPITLRHYLTKRPVTLTLQQSKCLRGLVQAKSAKEIGKTMHLSHRTVEHYFGRIRYYLGCKTNKEVLFRYGNQLALVSFNGCL